MRWRPLAEFRDRSVGKIDRLRRAARRGIAVPRTVWETADRARGAVDPPAEFDPPWIVRSAAADEDTGDSTAAGRYESVAVHSAGDFGDAVARVVSSMESAGGGRAAVFVQPLLQPEVGGVAFFDGFSYERTEAAGGNQALTAGAERGEVHRADYARGEPWSEWLRRVHAVFRHELRAGAALDVEYARTGDEFTLLQARPARFPIRRNPVLSLANHREILGDHPSPWIVDALVQAGRGALEEFVRIDPEVGRWEGQYAEKCAGRAWLSFSFFFRLMDHWGLPRTFVTEGVGGDAGSADDARVKLGTMLRRSPRLVRLQLQNKRAIRGIPRALAALDASMDGARTLEDWFEATAFGLDVALRTNFAINGAWTGVARMRRFLGVKGRARVVTEEMMDAYEALALLPQGERTEGLEGWLQRFGHRGPLESDPMQPRFRELRGTLEADLASRPVLTDTKSVESPAGGRGADSASVRTGLFFRIDETRERFRDDLMLRWERLRMGILRAAEEEVAGGRLDGADDAFLLDAETVRDPDAWRESVTEARERRVCEAAFSPPMTARRDEVEAAFEGEAGAVSDAGTSDEMRGIGVGDGVVRGRVRRASDLPSFLRYLGEARDGDEPLVLVVPALEPSWAVAFGRVDAVVTEIGGELSHASILLRESRTPAVVNCPSGARILQDGDSVEVDAEHGRVRLLNPFSV